MAIYSINDIEQLTGIKAHTLRIWEKRYGIDFAHRSPSNVRYYLDDDLKSLMNISILYKNGIKISKIAKFSPSEIREQVARMTEVHQSHSLGLDALTLSLINLDQATFDRIININAEQNGFKVVLEQLIFPLFDKINEMYLTGTIKPVHEGFLNYMLEGKLMAEIDRLRSQWSLQGPDYMIFQPSHGGEEIGSMILNYYLLYSGKYTLNLGSISSSQDIIDAHHLHPCNYLIGLFNTEMSAEDLKIYVNEVLDGCPGSHLILSGFWVYQAGIEDTDRVSVMPDLNAILGFLETRNETVQ